MSVEFRQRTAGEFVRMLKRRKWLILLPVITMTAAIGYVVYRLPSVYESKTLLTVKPPTISEKVVQSLTDDDLTERLQTINQQILSRSSLEPMVAKYKLFELEKDAGVPMELIIEKMYKNITVEPERTEGAQKVAAFKIIYRDRSPEAARNVAAELASKYVNAQVLDSTERAKDTQDFIDKQLNQAKASLDTLERQRLDIMTQNVDTLPESSQGLIAQLEGLRGRENTIAKEKETLITEKGRLNDSIRALNSQARLIENFGEKETQEAIKGATQIEDTPAYAQLVQKRAELTSKLQNLKLTLREKHPEVIKGQNDIDKVNDEIEKLKQNTQARVKTASVASSRKAEMQKQNLEIEKQKAESQIAQIEQQMQYKDEELRHNAGQIVILEGKINTIPNVKVALEGINNQYMSAKTTYDDFLKKRNDANLQVDRESNAQGETIRVQDAANLPSSPVAPKRGMLTALGTGIGLLIGLFLAAVFELPRVLKIQNIEDAKHYTGLPVLASVPALMSHEEKVWLRRVHWFKVMAGIVAAIGFIPLIVIVLEKTRVFDRVVS
jgi:polysaccharide chain length determinant protein (PEP-CTERM system associated)